MKKVFTTILLTTSIIGLSHAAPVSRSSAQKVAARFFGTTTTSPPAPKMVSSARRAASSQAAYYVFNASDKPSFVIVSGDDRTPEIIGYSKSEAFDTDGLPANIQAYLDGVKAQIDYLDRTKAAAKQVPARVATTHLVAPLLSSTWNQDSPYSDQCPTVTEGQTTNVPCATGCVATAMAQVLNYYRYPSATTAEIPAYTTSTRQLSLEAVAANTTIDWNNMLNTYTSSATAEQKSAVANLMSYVGRAVEMDYNTAQYGGSGAYNNKIAPALRKYFGFPNAYDLDRSSTTLADFQQKVYEDIANNRPVILCGSSSGGGHCFVADGYDGDNYFHINWGWGGLCDGYFLLSLLNPDSNSGIGASSTSDGYTMYNSAVLGIAPQGQAVTKPAQGLTFIVTGASGNQITVNAYNMTGGANTFEYGLGYIDNSGDIKLLSSVGTTGQLNPNYGYSSLPLTLSGLQDGTYKVYPISRVKGTTEWAYSTANMVKVTVSNGQYTSEVVTYKGHLSATGLTLPATLLSGTTVSASAAVTNSSEAEFYGTLYLYSTSAATTGSSSVSPTLIGNVGATLDAGKTTTVTLPFTTPAAGTYTLSLYADYNRQQLICSQNITVTDGTTSYDASKMAATITVENLQSGKVYGHSLKGTVTYTNNATTEFKGTVEAALVSPQGRVLSLQPSTVTISAGGSVILPFNFDNRQTGTNYYVYGLLPLNSALNVCGYSSSVALSKGIERTAADGTTVNLAPTPSYQAEATDLAVDLTESEGSVTTVNSNDNPNTLYLFATETAAAKVLKDAGKNVIVGGQADNIALEDGHGFSSPVEFTAKKISYTRVPSNGITTAREGWETLALPFDVTSVTVDGQPVNWFRSAADKGKDFWLMYFNEVDGNTVVYDYVGDRIDANIPYLLAVPDDKWGKQYSLVGKSLVFSATDAVVPVTSENKCISGSMTLNYRGLLRDAQVSDAYVLTDDGTAFEKAQSKTVPAFHAYFAESGVSFGNVLTIARKQNGTTTPISLPVLPETQEKARYNLQGQRVDNSYKGIVIVDGKKVMKK